MSRHVEVPRRESHDAGRVLYWHLRDDLPGLYTVKVGTPQSFVHVPADVSFTVMSRRLVRLGADTERGEAGTE